MTNTSTIKEIIYIKPRHSTNKTKLIECALLRMGLPWNDDNRYCIVKLPDGQVWGCKKYDEWELRERFTDMEATQKPTKSHEQALKDGDYGDAPQR